ncbi:MAG: hypothetical protein ACRENP_21350 [Longimicrobiales bacterium]
MKPGLGLVSVASASLILAACIDPMSSDRNDGRSASKSTESSRYVLKDYVMTQRFEVALEVSGELRPNEPIELRVRTHGLMGTDNVELRISAPEVQAARATAWGSDFRVPVGVTISPLDVSRTAIDVGATQVRQSTLTIPAPGYYRVVATARALVQPTRVRGKPQAEDAAHKVLWLWITESGGRVTDKFDPTLLPDSAIRQPGPLRFHRRAMARQGRSADAVMSPGTRTWEVLYYDDYWNQYEPVVGATVTGTEGPAGGSTMPVNETTNIDGEFSTGCDDEVIYGYNMEVNAENAALIVTPNSVVATFNGAPSGCGDEQILVEHDAESHVFNHTRLAISNSIDFFDQGRSQVPVEINALVSWSGYDPSADEIIIKSSHVFTLAIMEITAHEFGHALHHDALGGLPSNPPYCSFHGYSLYTNLKCAYVEGFAEYVSVVTRPDALGGLADDFEDNEYLLVNANPDGSNPNDPDGTVIEGAVAAFLFDLTDAANEATMPSHSQGTTLQIWFEPVRLVMVAHPFTRTALITSCDAWRNRSIPRSIATFITEAPLQRPKANRPQNPEAGISRT